MQERTEELDRHEENKQTASSVHTRVHPGSCICLVVCAPLSGFRLRMRARDNKGGAIVRYAWMLTCLEKRLSTHTHTQRPLVSVGFSLRSSLPLPASESERQTAARVERVREALERARRDNKYNDGGGKGRGRKEI